jgi:potassium-transporting ATPase potassium-binding subunit
VIIAVFVSGLMVGRTPEYLGKKIEAYEMKMAALVVLIPSVLALTGTALAVILPVGKTAVLNPGPHGFSEVLYAFSSAANNNGSAFAGLAANNLFYNLATGLFMLIGRYWLAIPILAIAGSLARKKKVPASAGTLPTYSPLFVSWLIAVIIIVGALSFFPALSLGPVVEHLIMGG